MTFAGPQLGCPGPAGAGLLIDLNCSGATPVGFSSIMNRPISQAARKVFCFVAAAIIMSLQASFAAPANDLFASAQVITGEIGQVTGSNVGATLQAGEPDHWSGAAQASVWYRWTAPGNGPVTFNTIGSNYDTILAVYRGSTIGALTRMANNDDFHGLQSEVAFAAVGGVTYQIAVAGYSAERGAIVLNWNIEVEADNDFFANARAMSPLSGTLQDSNTGATAEAGEPCAFPLCGGRSIWFRWTPTMGGEFILETVGSAINTTLSVFTGTQLGNLTAVASNDDISAGTLQSRLTVDAMVGTTYYIAVDGANGAQGNVTLSWRSRNAIDLLPDIMAPADIGRGWIYGWRYDTQSEPGRRLMRVTTGTPNVGAGPLELQGSSQSPDVQQRIYRSDGSTYTRYAGTFTFHPEHGHIHFDSFMQFRLRRVGPDNTVGEIVGTGAKMSFAIIDLATYDRTLPGSPASGRYGGGLLQGISVGYTDIYDQGITGQHIDITNIPDGTYWLEAEVDPENRILESNENNNFGRILVTIGTPAPPANDNFANATSVEVSTRSFVGNNMGATVETGEPTHANQRARSVWYRWTAPASGPASVTTQGSDFDTTLAVYTGSAVGSLTRVGQNDNATGTTSAVNFTAAAGMVYYIAVDAVGGVGGNFVVNINPAGNDLFANAAAISGPAGATTGSTYGASRESGEPAHAGAATLAGSIWFVWTAPSNGQFIFDTVGSSFNTLLGVYTGTAVNALTQVAADNDTAGNFLSRVMFNATAGTRYYIAVDGNGNITQRGFVGLHWSAGVGPCEAPTIVTAPQSGPRQVGSETTLSVVATAESEITYQWFFSAEPGAKGQPIANSARISGATTANLRIQDIQLSDAGFYLARVTACDPALVTMSTAAQLVVTTDAVNVALHDVAGVVGERICTEIELNSQGGVRRITGTVTYDAAVFSDATLSATEEIGQNNLLISHAPGRIGFDLSLPDGIGFAIGHNHVLQLCLTAAGTAASSPIGFNSDINAMALFAADGTQVNATFSAGAATIRRPTRATASISAEGRLIINISGNPGGTATMRSSATLEMWSGPQTIILDAQGNGSLDLPLNPRVNMFYGFGGH